MGRYRGLFYYGVDNEKNPELYVLMGQNGDNEWYFPRSGLQHNGGMTRRRPYGLGVKKGGMTTQKGHRTMERLNEEAWRLIAAENSYVREVHQAIENDSREEIRFRVADVVVFRTPNRTSEEEAVKDRNRREKESGKKERLLGQNQPQKFTVQTSAPAAVVAILPRGNLLLQSMDGKDRGTGILRHKKDVYHWRGDNLRYKEALTRTYVHGTMLKKGEWTLYLDSSERGWNVGRVLEDSDGKTPFVLLKPWERMKPRGVKHDRTNQWYFERYQASSKERVKVRRLNIVTNSFVLNQGKHQMNTVPPFAYRSLMGIRGVKSGPEESQFMLVPYSRRKLGKRGGLLCSKERARESLFSLEEALLREVRAEGSVVVLG